jgi:hypothetical protein
MCIRDDHRHCQELRSILEVAENAKASTAIVHIERDLEHIDADRYNRTGYFLVIFHGNYDVLFG